MSNELKIAVIEDDSLLQDVYREILGASTQISSTSTKFLNEAKGSFNLIFLDLCNDDDLEGKKSVEVNLPLIKNKYPQAEIVVFSGVNDIDVMRECIKNGADKFLLKDHAPEYITAIVEECSSKQKLLANLNSHIIGNSPLTKKLKASLVRAREAQGRPDVLIEGETGTGKEICARFIHEDGPFVAVNSSAIPEELFESEFFGHEKGSFTGATQSKMGLAQAAQGGCLFIDEIQSLSLKSQAKILRFIESRTFTRVGSTRETEFKGRIVCATNKNLKEVSEKGEFREDLFFRISNLHITVPPLRQRVSDIKNLVDHFSKIDSISDKKFTPEAIEALQVNYDWPGNIRELKSCVTKLQINTPIPLIGKNEVLQFIEGADEEAVHDHAALAGHFKINEETGLDENVTELEKFMITKAISELGSTKAREKLKITRSRFYEKLKTLKISK